MINVIKWFDIFRLRNVCLISIVLTKSFNLIPCRKKVRNFFSLYGFFLQCLYGFLPQTKHIYEGENKSFALWQQIIETLRLYRHTTWKYFEHRLIVHGSFTWTISASVVGGNVFFFSFQILFVSILLMEIKLSNYQANIENILKKLST